MSKIYISSTFNDLADHRTAVIRALRQMNKIVVAMEDYTASDERPFDRCLADVAACDVYVGIFAHCYGFIPIANNPDRLSITELELRQAEVLGKQKFIFLVDETARWSPLNMDVHTKQGDSGTRVAELRDRLSHTTMVRFFDGPDDLATSVTTAVARWQEQQHEVAALSAEATFARRGARSIAGAREEDGGGWSVEPTPAQVMTTAPLPLPDKPSLAVLPFQNLSGDPEQEYFVDGVVEDIITALSRTGWLFVIARNSSFTYKGQAHDIRRVGRDLGVRYVLEGSIRRAGGRVRVTGQLNDAVTGGHIWADRFESEFDNIFDLQDRITESVVGALEPNLQRAEIDRAMAKPTKNLGAYDLYLRALPHHYAVTEPDSRAAMALLRRALAMDPGYVRAKGVLAYNYGQRVAMGWADPGEREMAVVLAREILAAGTGDPDALGNAGIVLSSCAADFPAAFTALNRSLLLHPNSAQMLHRLAYVHVQTVDPEPAVGYFERAMRLSPLDPEIGFMLAGIAMAHNQAKRFEQALPYAKKAVEEMPNNAPAHRTVIYAQVGLGRLEEARAAAARLLAIRPNWRAASSGWPPRPVVTEYRQAVIQALITAGIPE
jgi:TolB-like protein/Tfp pilus assembly protein PilF